MKLEWTITPKGQFRLLDGLGNPLPPAADLATADVAGSVVGSCGFQLSETRRDFTLEVLQAADQVCDTRRLRINAIARTEFKSYVLSIAGNRAGILGLYAQPRQGRLYTLLSVGNAGMASLYWSESGFDQDQGLTTGWQPETDKRGPVPAIALDVARRPGVIFQDKLWLVGGDCCHPDRVSAEVDVYDFQSNAWTTGKGWPSAPQEMAARMGHAVVVLPDPGGNTTLDRLWVMEVQAAKAPVTTSGNSTAMTGSRRARCRTGFACSAPPSRGRRYGSAAALPAREGRRRRSAGSGDTRERLEPVSPARPPGAQSILNWPRQQLG